MTNRIGHSTKFVVSSRSLRIVAALVWYFGGIVLLLKGSSLLMEVGAMREEKSWPWVAVVAGAFFGYLKAKFLFRKSCRTNFDRIAALNRPRIWQFFSPGFFVALAVMILAGATLSILAHNNYPLLVGVAILDLAIGIALIGSGDVYWRWRACVK